MCRSFAAATASMLLLLCTSCAVGPLRQNTKRPLGDRGVSMKASVRPVGDRGVSLEIQLTNKTSQTYVVADGVPASASTKNPVADNSRVYAVRRPDLSREYGGEVVEFALRTFNPWPSTPDPGPLLMRGSVMKPSASPQIRRTIKDVGVLNSPFRGLLGKDYRPGFALVCVGVIPVGGVRPELQPTEQPTETSASPSATKPPEFVLPDSPVLAHGTQQYVLCSPPQSLEWPAG